MKMFILLVAATCGEPEAPTPVSSPPAEETPAPAAIPAEDGEAPAEAAPAQ